MGFLNATGESWFLNEPTALRTLVKLGLQDLNMFEKAMFLHSGSLVSIISQGAEGFDTVKIGQDVGKVALWDTSLPLGVPQEGLLVIALDPLRKLDDLDRTDNVFVQYVTVNGTTEDGEWVDKAVCKAEGVGIGRRGLG